MIDLMVGHNNSLFFLGGVVLALSVACSIVLND